MLKLTYKLQILMKTIFFIVLERVQEFEPAFLQYGETVGNARLVAS